MKGNKKGTPWFYRIFSLWFFTLFFFLEISTIMAATWYVDDAGSGDGLSWATAYGDIATAITSAAAGDEIWIKEGTYAITDYIVIFKSLSLYGGFPAGLPSPLFTDRDPSSYPSIVDGQNSVPHCFRLVDGGIVLDGIDITRGNYSTKTYTFGEGGAGVRIEANSNNNTLRNCRIYQNISVAGGGGVTIYNSVGTTIDNCTFDNNQAVDQGGALHIIGRDTGIIEDTSIINSTFTDNYTTASMNSNGGAIYAASSNSTSPLTPLTITGSTFTSNHAGGKAGAIYTGALTNYLISDCEFTGNYINYQNSSYGGAIYTGGGEGEISNCSFTGNYSADTRKATGGAIHATGPSTIKNCIFTANEARLTDPDYEWGKGWGGAIYVHAGAEEEVLISQCTFKENTSDIEGGAIAVYSGSSTIENCLFAGNAALSKGGAVSIISYETPSGSTIINNSTFTENYASSGGAIYHYGDELQIWNSVI